MKDDKRTITELSPCICTVFVLSYVPAVVKVSVDKKPRNGASECGTLKLTFQFAGMVRTE